MIEDDTDRALAAKDARIAELEEAHTELLADFIMRNRDRFDAHRSAIKAEVALSLVEAEVRDLRAALAAEKARAAKLEREVANVSAAALAQKMLADSLRMSLEAEKAARVKAVEAEREACATTLETWADSEDREALLKRPDAPCSAESHEESAIIARRHAGLIRARGGR